MDRNSIEQVVRDRLTDFLKDRVVSGEKFRTYEIDDFDVQLVAAEITDALADEENWLIDLFDEPEEDAWPEPTEDELARTRERVAEARRKREAGEFLTMDETALLATADSLERSVKEMMETPMYDLLHRKKGEETPPIRWKLFGVTT